MRLSLTGASLGGSTQAWLEGAPLPLPNAAGNPHWWNGRPLFQTREPDERFKDGWRYFLATGPPVTEVDAEGQSFLFASAGTDYWARQLNGFKDSRGLVKDDWSVVAVDDVSPRAAIVVSGALAIWDGIYLNVVDPTGADRWTEGDIHFSRGVLGYRNGGRLRAYGRPDPVQVPGAGVRFDGEFVLTYQERRGLVLHTWNDPRGLVIAAGDNFNPDIRDLGNGRIRVVAGLNQGDEGEHRYNIDWNAGTVNGEATEKIDLSALPAPPAWHVEPFRRQIGVLPFFVNHSRYGVHRATPGHGEVLNDHADASQRAANTPYIADPSVSGLDRDLIAVYSDSRFDIDGDAATARRLGVPLVLYHDGPTYPLDLLVRLRPGDLPCVQAYLQRGETPKAAAKRIGDTCLAVSQRWPFLALAWMSYTGSGAFPLADVLELQPLLVAIVRSNPAIRLLLPFAWARPSGCLDHPELGAWVAALVAASDGLPTLIAPAPTPVPIPPAPLPTTPPIPAPVIPPAPVEETADMALPKSGDHGAYRELGSTGTPVNATIVDCQDDGFLSLVDDQGLVQFDTNTGKISGHKPGVTVGTGAERIKFQTANVFVCRAGDLARGPLTPYEWYAR